MQPPPRVTITDPSRPDPGPVDELDGEQPRSRRGLYAVLAVVALLAGARGVDTVLDRRAADAEERRLAAVVELEVASVVGGREGRDLQDVATVEREVAVRNAGPRPVELLSASFGPLAFEGEVRVAPDGSGRLLLARTQSCAQQPGPSPDDGVLRVSVRTAGGDVVERRVPVGDDLFLTDPDVLRRACGYLEPYEAGSGFPTGTARLTGGSVLVDFFLGNGGRDPLVLASLGGGSGMRAELETADGTPVRLPVEVVPGTGSGLLPPLSLVLRLTVQDCAVVVPPDLTSVAFDQQGAAVVRTLFARPGEQPREDFAALSVLDPPRALADLIAESCP